MQENNENISGKSVEYLEALEKLRLADKILHVKDKAKLMGVEAPMILGDVTVLEVSESEKKDDEPKQEPVVSAPQPAAPPVETSSPEQENQNKNQKYAWLKKTGAALAMAVLAAGGGAGAYRYFYPPQNAGNDTQIVISKDFGMEVEVIRRE